MSVTVNQRTEMRMIEDKILLEALLEAWKDIMMLAGGPAALQGYFSFSA
jgi:hypothetical protein